MVGGLVRTTLRREMTWEHFVRVLNVVMVNGKRTQSCLRGMKVWEDARRRQKQKNLQIMSDTAINLLSNVA